jgi:undecaprenyl-diphosphatase
MDIFVQAVIMGIVQGLTEFLPISSSGHLIVVPFLLDVDDAFLNSLAFSVMLHVGTGFALLAYFWRDWVRLVPAGLAAVRDRSFKGDKDRRLAWLLAATTIPGGTIGFLFEDPIATTFRHVGLVAVTLVIGAAILWLADRWRGSQRHIDEITFPIAIAIGAAQALALIPGISRSGISISAGRFAGLDRESAARFSFLMLAPITAAAGVYEGAKLVTGGSGAELPVAPLVVGMLAALVSGLLAIHGLLRFLRTRSLEVFVLYRLLLAATVLVVWLAR